MAAPDYKDRLAGSPTAAATSFLVGTTPVQLVASHGERVAYQVQPDGNVFVGQASSFTASTLAFAYVPSGGLYNDPDYRGAAFAKSEGATVLVRLRDVRY